MTIRSAKTEDWWDKASCRGVGPNVLFPLGEIEQSQVAVELCGACAVRAECLNFALETRQEHGVWGGTTEAERRTMHITTQRQKRA